VPPRALIEPERLQPGDVLVVRDRSLIGRLLRRGAGFSDSVNGWNHVVVASHRDASGTFWGVEAKPSRVGEVVIDHRVADRWSLANWDQPKTVAQRDRIVEVCRGLLDTPYDWSGIVRDAMNAIHAPTLWGMKGWGPDDGVPTHVVCSSLATYAYQRVGVPAPGGGEGGGRWATPWDWASWIIEAGWRS
jgi:hypothetical protein